MEKELLGREVIFKAMVGSKAFGLDNKHSREGYNVCLAPLSGEKSFFQNVKSDSDIEMNAFTVNSIKEILFLGHFIPIWFTDHFEFEEGRYPEIKWIRDNREEIYKSNIKSLYANFISIWERSLSSYTFHPNSLLTSYWLFVTLKRYRENGFSSFYEACRPEKKSYEYWQLMRIKNGSVRKEESLTLIQELYEDLKGSEEDFDLPKNEDINEELKDLIMSLEQKFNNKRG